ncbi:MAG: hypothetical protein LBL55_09725, partial [Propionibacteriaceae bacterium]|nr:hypothetical protein [Propionibacteriaceae bacterium]
MTSAPSTKFRRALHRAWKPVAWISAVALAVGGVTVAQQWQSAPEAEAAYPSAYGWGQHTFGTGGVTWDTNKVYTVRDSSNEGIWSFTTNPAGSSWPGLITGNARNLETSTAGGGDGLETMAVDGGVYTGDPSGYFWGWNQHTYNITYVVGTKPSGSNWISIESFGSGHTVSRSWLVPAPSRAHGATSTSGYGHNYWSGGEVIQKTGEIFFSGGECNSFNARGGAYRMMIYNPKTGNYRASGVIQPASASDDIFGSSDTSCGRTAVGKVSSDMALDGF